MFEPCGEKTQTLFLNPIHMWTRFWSKQQPTTHQINARVIITYNHNIHITNSNKLNEPQTRVLGVRIGSFFTLTGLRADVRMDAINISLRIFLRMFANSSLYWRPFISEIIFTHIIMFFYWSSLPEQINKCQDLIQTVPLFISLPFFSHSIFLRISLSLSEKRIKYGDANSYDTSLLGFLFVFEVRQ